MNPYATNKAIHHPDRLQALAEGRQPAPVHLQIVVSDLCDQDCSFCAYRTPGYSSNEMFGALKPDGTETNNPNRQIDGPKVVDILHQAKELGVKAVQFTGGGEPAVHRELPTLLRVARTLGLEVSLVTNGAKLKGALAEAALDLSWIRISLDAGTGATYAATRRVSPGVFDQVLKNVEDLVQARNRTDSSLFIGLGFVVTRDNWPEVLIARAIAEAIGVDNLRLSAVFQNDGADYYADFGQAAAEACALAAQSSNERLLVSDNFSDRMSDLAQGRPDYERCVYQHFTTYVGGDLNLYRCCVLAYNRHGLIGSLKGASLKDLWESDYKRADFATFDARNCDRCMFNQRNREMNAMVDSMPLGHWNFV